MWKELLRRPQRISRNSSLSSSPRKTCFRASLTMSSRFSRGRLLLLLLLIMSRLVLGCKICVLGCLYICAKKKAKFDNSACFHHRSRTNRNGSKSFCDPISNFFLFNFFLLRLRFSFYCFLMRIIPGRWVMMTAMMMLMMIITMDWCLLFVEIFALFSKRELFPPRYFWIELQFF